MNSRRALFYHIVAAMVSLPGAAFAGEIYWTSDQGGTVFRANADGSDPVALYSGLAEPVGLAVDSAGGRLFWAQRGDGTIRSANLDGTGPVSTVVTLTPGHGLRGVAVDAVHGKVYWVAETLSKIQRADFDGTNVVDVRDTLENVIGVTLDPYGGKIYWGEYDGLLNGQLFRANLDGSAMETIADEDVETPYYFTLDLGAGHIYWTDYRKRTVERANLDGTARMVPPPISNLANAPIGVALDKAENKVFWTLTSGEIQRANPDGTVVETIVANQGSTWDIAVGAEPTSGPVPATSTWGLVALMLAMLTGGSLIVGRAAATPKSRNRIA